MKIKPNTYYKGYYTNSIFEYDILYTDTKYVYIIAEKEYDNPLDKFDKKFKWGTINDYQDYIDMYSIKIKELTKEEVFLEML